LIIIERENGDKRGRRTNQEERGRPTGGNGGYGSIVEGKVNPRAQSRGKRKLGKKSREPGKRERI